VVGLWRWYHVPKTIQQVGLWSVLGFYLPMLAIVLLRARADRTQSQQRPWDNGAERAT
jgi:hypothetical protein